MRAHLRSIVVNSRNLCRQGAVLTFLGCSPLLNAQAVAEKSATIVNDQFQLEFIAPPGALSQLTLQSSDSLAGEWVLVQSAVFTDLGGGNFRVIQPIADGNPKNFYRVLLDDQLLVASFGTNPVVVEGDGGGQIAVTLSSPFTGSVPYEISFADDTPNITGSVSVVNATSLNIPFVASDDGEAKGSRFANLTIFPDTSNGGTTNFEIEENDQIWDGVFVQEGGGELVFCLERTRAGGTETACLVNPNGGNFFPTGKGPLVMGANYTFTSTDLEITLESASLPSSESPFELPLTYEISLTGAALPDADDLVFQGDGVLLRKAGLMTDLQPDYLEPNEEVSAAPFVSFPVGETSLTLPSSDNDHFRFTPPVGEEIYIQLQFAHEYGDIDLALHSSDGTRLKLSQSSSDNETLTYTSSDGSALIVRAYGYSGATNQYDLFIGSAPRLLTDFSRLHSETSGSFMLTRRPLAPADREVTLSDNQ